MDSAKKSLAYILADSGFDVWLGNVRGNDYSRRHLKHTPNQSIFWNWRSVYDKAPRYGLIKLFINCSSVFIVRILWRVATETKVSRKGARENLPSLCTNNTGQKTYRTLAT